MTSRYTYPLIFSVLLFWGNALGQVCSINLGQDSTVCQGQTVTLALPAGFPNYLWSTGSSATSITVGTSGSYWGQVSYPTGELATNGNFSSGNTGFGTQFNYNNTLTTDGNYWIGTNAASYHPQFIGTGNGAFLIVNAGWMHAGWEVWCQTITVCPEQTYTLSARAMSLASQGSPLLDWAVDGVQQGLWMQTASQGQWTTFTNTWTSAPGQTSATFCIRVASGHGVGNDLGLDDISISSTIVLRDDVNINVTPLPIVNLGPNATLCVGQNLVLDAGVVGGTYLWQDGATSSTYVVSGPGNYSVTVTANNCSASDAITVNYNALPVVDLGPDLTLCTSNGTTLNATLPGATYVWQDGSTSPSFSVTTPGTYTVSVTQNNCTASDAVDIAYNATPTVNIGMDQTICEGGQVLLDATTPGASYLWQDGSTAPTLVATTTGTYSAQVTVNNCPASDAMDLTVTPLPTIDLGPDQTICPGASVVLDATFPGGNYVWQDGSAAATFSASTPGLYSVQVTANNCAANDTFVLSQYTPQTVDLGPDFAICQGQSATIGSAVPGATYLWNTGEMTSDISVNSAGTYWLDVFLNGCVVRDSVLVSVTPLPVFDLGADFNVCPGTQATLDATVVGATYLWNSGASSPTVSAGPGAYDVTVTANGCIANDAITIGTWPAAVVDLGTDVTICPGSLIVLDVTQSGATYHWQDGSSASTFSVSAAGMYDVILTDVNGCTATDAISVVIAAPAPISLGSDTTICQGTALTLDVTVPGATYLWNTGAITPVVNASTAGVYSVVVTQGTCTVGDAIDVQVAALPTVDLGPDMNLCPGEDIVLDATGSGLSFSWSTGAATPTITATVGGPYSVVVTNAANCSASDAINVSYDIPVNVDLGSDLILCQGSSATLNAFVPGASYVWSTGAQTSTLTVNSTGAYSVIVTQGNCTVSDAIDVQVNPMPAVALGSDTTLCAGEDVLLDAEWPGATYLWNTGASTATITAAATGTYSVDVTLNGCTVSDAIDVTVLSASSLDLGPDTTICEGGQVVLDATTPGATYLWSTGATTETLTVATAGIYSVEVFSGNCSVTDVVTVTVNPIPTVSLGSDTTLCAGENVLLDAEWPGATYLWNTGASTATITAATTGTYSVDVTLNGCTVSDAIDVTVLSASSLDLGPDTTICEGDQVVLDATTPGATYLWSTGATTETLTVATAGIYSVEVFSGNCSVTDVVTVTVNQIPTVSLGGDTTLCAGEDVLLDAEWPGATYLWNTGASTATITAATTGTYSVDVTLNGCTVSDAIDVTVLSASSLDLGPDTTICEGGQVVLDATTPGATYLWSTGATTETLTVATAGIYSVEVFSGNCSVTDIVTVTANPSPTVDLGPDQVYCEGESSTLLDASFPGATFLWEDGETTATHWVSTSGVHSVEVDLNGCTASDAITVTFGSLTYELGNDTTLCPGETLLLGNDASIGVTTWNDAVVAPTFSVNAPGTYWVDYSGSTGCNAVDTIIVSYTLVGSLELGTDLSVCAGTFLSLDASIPNATYLWNDGSTDPLRMVSASGVYSVEAFVGQCSVSDLIEVTVVPLPLVDLGPDVALCPENEMTFDATLTGATYLWSDGSTSSTHTTGTAGVVSVVVTVDGCSASDESEVTIIDGPDVELGSDTVLCAGASVAFALDGTDSNILWENGSTSPLRVVDQEGTIWVEVTRNSCVVRDSISVHLFAPDAFDIGADRTICSGATTVIDAFMPGAQYAWSNGATTPAITVPGAGVYGVTISLAGCTAEDEMIVSVLEMEPPDLGLDVVLCEGNSTALSVASSGANVSWSTGETTPTIHVSSAGVYAVTIDSLGCTASSQISVSVIPNITELDLGPDQRICGGTFALIEAPLIPGAHYAWSTGSSGQLISVSQPGIYTVTATGTCIEATASVIVEAADCGTYVNIPNAFTPNGDGINDRFLPVVSGPVDRYELDIFDRWGERIHTTEDRAIGWDGSYSGVPSQDGVYVWTLTYRVLGPQGVKSERLTGHVTLLR